MRKLGSVSSGQPDLAQQLVHARQHGGFRQQLLEADGLRDGCAYPVTRVERGVGILEDHLNAMAGFPGIAETHLTASGRVQASDQARQRGLAATRFTHQAEGLAALDVEPNAVDGAHRLCRAT